MSDFICLGDATVDNFFFIDEASVACSLFQDKCVLQLQYGQKIPVTRHAVTLGGNAANVSAGLSRLGVGTGIVTIFGDDEHGVWIKKQLMSENVDVTNSITAGGSKSNISAIILFKEERTILSYHFPQAEQIKNLPPSSWLYLTSSPGTDSTGLFDLVKSANPMPRLAFNPSVPDLKKGKEYLWPIIEKTEVLILNKEEFDMLKTKGPKITIVTDGKNGATVYDGDKTISKPAIGGKAIEPTGAGDAFSSGFLAAIYYGKTVEEALDWGLKNSASTVQKIGAIEGLLKKDEIS